MRYLWKYRRNRTLIHCWYESVLVQPHWESFRQCLIKLNGGSVGKESSCNAGDCLPCRKPGQDLWVRNIPWRRKWQPTPVFLPGKSQTEEPGGLQSTGSRSQTWGSDCTTTTATRAEYIHITYPPLLEIYQCTYQRCVQVYCKNVCPKMFSITIYSNHKLEISQMPYEPLNG